MSSNLKSASQGFGKLLKYVMENYVDKVKLMVFNDCQDASTLSDSEYRSNFVIDIVSKFKSCYDSIK